MKIEALRSHMAGGSVILLLMLVRLFVRMVTRHPASASTGNPTLDRLAWASHRLLYVTVLGMAGSGIVMFLRDEKVRTTIFPDLAVGDTIVLRAAIEKSKDLFPGQFADQFVFPRDCCRESPRLTQISDGLPVLTIDTQGVGETPGIELIVFDTAGSLAYPVGLSALGVQWIDVHAGFQQLFHGRTLAGLDREGNRAVGSHPVTELLPP